MADEILTAERLREVVDYNPETGVLTRKVRLAQRHRVGDRADMFWPHMGYWRLSIDSRRYLAHRCAWLYVHGRWPEHNIDHINGNPADNRIANLRDVPQMVNVQNQRTSRAASGLIGAQRFADGVWRARIKVNGKYRHIGLYDTPEEAHRAYIAAKRKLHEGCTI